MIISEHHSTDKKKIGNFLFTLEYKVSLSSTFIYWRQTYTAENLSTVEIILHTYISWKSFYVFMVIKTKVVIFWVMTPSFISGYKQISEKLSVSIYRIEVYQKYEASDPSKMLVTTYKTTWWHNPEDKILIFSLIVDQIKMCLKWKCYIIIRYT